MASSGKRTRGPNKRTPWSRNPDDGMSVVRLALDTSDPTQRRRLEAMFWTGYQVRRALQRQARSACRAYWAATHERRADPAAVRNASASRGRRSSTPRMRTSTPHHTFAAT